MQLSFACSAGHDLPLREARKSQFGSSQPTPVRPRWRPAPRHANLLQCCRDFSRQEVPVEPEVSLFWKVGRAAFRGDTPREVSIAVRQALSQASLPSPPDLLLVFFSGLTAVGALGRFHAVVLAELKMAQLWKDETILIGSTMEQCDPKLCTIELVAARLPNITVQPFRIGQNDCPVNIDWRQHEWALRVGCDDQAIGKGSKLGRPQNDDELPALGPQFILLQHQDFVANDLLAGLDFAFPNSAKIGGACGSSRPANSGVLIAADGSVHDSGVVGVLLKKTGPGVVFEVVVAQGVRPVGTRLKVLEVKDGSEISKVRDVTGAGVSIEGGPMQIIDMWAHTGFLDEEEAELAGKYIGVEIEIPSDLLNSYSGGLPSPSGDTSIEEIDSQASVETESPVHVPADILVRRIVGIDLETNAIAVDGPPVRLGTGVRFQIRDAASAQSEIEKLRGLVRQEPIGGLLVTDRERLAILGDADGSEAGALDLRAFGGCIGRFMASSEIGPLPAPGYRKHFPIRSPGAAASTFSHSSSSIYLLVFDESESKTGGRALESVQEMTTPRPS
jgi:hypothetical protein